MTAFDDAIIAGAPMPAKTRYYAISAHFAADRGGALMAALAASSSHGKSRGTVLLPIYRRLDSRL